METRRLIEIQRLIEKKVLYSIEHAPQVKDKDSTLFIGLDAAYSSKYGGVGVAAVVNNNCQLIKYKASLGEPSIPYIPGLLAFREAPLLYAALYPLLEDIRHRLLREHVVLVVDGHGIAHPRHTGIASHIGLALGSPSIGVAKKKLYGKVELNSRDCGTRPCVEGYIVEDRKTLALIIRTVTGSRIYVSPGANIRLQDAVHFVLKCLDRRPLPAPTYYADKLSKRLARSLDKGALTPRQLVGEHSLPSP